MNGSSIGSVVDCTCAALFVQTPVVQVRENNWGLHYRNNLWSVTYDM